MDNNELIVETLSKEITKLVLISREKLKDEILRKTTINTMDMRQIDEKMSSNANQDNMELLKQAR